MTRTDLETLSLPVTAFDKTTDPPTRAYAIHVAIFSSASLKNVQNSLQLRQCNARLTSFLQRGAERLNVTQSVHWMQITGCRKTPSPQNGACDEFQCVQCSADGRAWKRGYRQVPGLQLSPGVSNAISRQSVRRIAIRIDPFNSQATLEPHKKDGRELNYTIHVRRTTSPPYNGRSRRLIIHKPDHVLVLEKVRKIEGD